MLGITLAGGSVLREARSALACDALVSDPQEGASTGAARALIDSGATRSFVSQRWAKQNLEDTKGVPRRVEAIDGHEIQSYGSREIALRLADSAGNRTKVLMTCESVDMSKYDMVLGMDWLRTVNPDIDWANGWWFYRGKPPLELEVVSPEEFEKDLERLNSLFSELRFVPHKPKGDAESDAEVLGAVGEEEPLPPQYDGHSDVFDAEQASILPEHTEHDHGIDLVPGEVVPFKPLYPLSIAESKVLDDYITENLAKGWIQHSKSQGGAPVLFAPKKDGKLRLCVDYRGLNAITVKNRHPLPLISESLARLAGARIYTKLDLRDAYHRIRIRKGDEWKTAFRTRYGHFEYRVMPFGLANAPATFQAYVNKALAGLIDTFVVVYLDDILIFSLDEDSHVEHVRIVLDRLREYKLYAKRSKCTFHTTEVEFLGFIVSSSGISMDPSRVQTIKEWPEPECIFDVQQFVGFANFYRRFIGAYSKIIGPLNALVRGPDSQKKGRNKRKADFTFTDEARKAFEEIKEIFQKAPMLAHFDPLLKSMVESDASGRAVGGICSQKQQNGEWKPIAFFSRKMQPAEMNYEVGDQEMLAIVECFKEWRHYLEGSAHQVVVKTDHANLVKFMTTKELTRRQVRWAEYLARYDFSIVFRAGTLNPADAPSRRPDYMKGSAEGDNHHTIFMRRLEESIVRGREEAGLPAETWVLGVIELFDEPLSPMEAHISRREAADALIGESALRAELQEPLVELVQKAQAADAYASERLAELEDPTAERGGIWSRTPKDGLLRTNGKVYIPEEPALKAEIMHVHHDDPVAGHYALKRTMEAIKSKFWWKNMDEFIRTYVEECQVCQSNAVKRHRPYGLLEPLPVPTAPMQWMSVDFITGLPPSRWDGQVYDAVMVAVDLFTKYALYVPCTKDITAEGLADKFYERIIPYFGMPENLVSDRGSVFTSEFWSRFCYLLATRRRLSTAFHPQTDGQTERQNQNLEYYLRSYVNWEQDDWVRWLPLAQMVYNNSKHSALDTSPSQALLGLKLDLRLSIQEQELEAQKDVDTRVGEMISMRDKLQTRLERAKEAMKRSADKKRMNMEFKVHDWVMLRNKNLDSKRPARKIDHRYIGPFQIAERVGQQAYKLILTPQYRLIHPTQHVSLLEPFKGEPHKNQERPGPVQVGNAEEWLIESILDSTKDGKHFYVKWLGYGESENTWEPLAHVEDTAALEEYLSKKARKTEEDHTHKPKRRGRGRRLRQNPPAEAAITHPTQSRGRT